MGASRRQDTEERAVLTFLERYLDDLERGVVHTLAEYQALFPEIPERIEAEYQALRGGAATGPAAPPRLGPYRLSRLIGKGGQGVVYEALDERFQRPVALKVLPRALGTAAGGLPAQLVREMETLSRLDHPNICVVYDAGEADGHAFLAMRLVQGESLADRIARESEERSAWGDTTGSSSRSGRRRVLESVALAEKVARALHAAHEAGVVHRDIKPGNILVAETGEPVVLDFGLARAAESATPSLTRTGDRIGTPHYMSPEQLRGEARSDPRTDVWSLGVTLYELVTGVRPFDGPTLETIARQIEQEEPADPRRLERAVTKDLSVVLATALEKRLARRYQSALDLAEDLARVGRGEPIRARAVSLPGRAERWLRRNPMPALLLLVLAAALVASMLAARSFRRVAAERSAALHLAEAHLARSAYEQARLLAFSTEHGRSWRMLDLVRDAAAAHGQAAGGAAASARAGPAGGPGTLPPLSDLRSVALEALLMPDARALLSVEHEGLTLGALSRNGAWLATRTVTPGPTRAVATAVGLVRMADGVQVAQSSLPGLLDGEEGLAVNGDGSLVALLGTGETTVDLWDLRAPRRLARLPLPDALVLAERTLPEMRRNWKLEFSPDGRFLAACVAPKEGARTRPTPRGFAVWDVTSGLRLAGGTSEAYQYPWLGFRNDSRRLAVVRGTRRAELFRLGAAAESLAVFDFDMPVRAATPAPGEAAGILAVLGEIEGEEDVLVVQRAGAVEPDLRVPLGCRQESPHASGLHVHPDGSLLAYADTEAGLRLLELAGGREVLHLGRAHRNRNESLAWTEAGFLVSHARGGTTRTWETVPDRGIVRDAPLPENSGPRGVLGIAPDGSRLALVHPSDAGRVWTWATGEAPVGHRVLRGEGPAFPVLQLLVESAGGRVGRVAFNRASLWGGPGGKEAFLEAEEGARFLHGRLLPGGGMQVVERRDTRFALRTIPGGEREDLDWLPGGYWLDADPEWRWLLLRPVDVQEAPPILCEVASRTVLPLADLPEQPVRDMRNGRLSRDGRWASTLLLHDQWYLNVWDTGTRKRVLEARMGQIPGWQCWAFHPTAALLAAGSEDGLVRLFDLEEGAELLSWRAHEGRVNLVTFLDDGRLCTWGGTGPARLLDVAALRARLAEAGVGW